MPTHAISATLRSALESLRTCRRFLKLVAYSAGSRQLRDFGKTTTTPPAWQDHNHPLHDLFRLECLDDDERQQLCKQSHWKKSPNFSWNTFAKSLDMEIALPLATLTMFRLYSSFEPRPNSTDRKLLNLAYWGDEDSWLTLIDLGNQYAWNGKAIRPHLASLDTSSVIAAPIRMLAEPYRQNVPPPPKSRYAPYMDYSYQNHRENDLLGTWWREKTPLEPLLKKALEDDAVYQAEIATSLSRHSRADVFASALIDHLCPQLVCDWLQKYSEAELGLSRQDTAKLLLLRVQNLQPISQILTVLESQQPGFARTVVAEDGGNLLWLVTPTASHRLMRRVSEYHCGIRTYTIAPIDTEPNLLPLLQFLVSDLGVSPFQRNKRGFSFADYDLVAHAIGQRPALVGLDNSVPGFHDRQFWGIDHLENDDSTHPEQCVSLL